MLAIVTFSLAIVILSEAKDLFSELHTLLEEGEILSRSFASLRMTMASGGA